MDYFLFYVSFEGKIMPIYCSEIEDDPIIQGHTLFKGVKHLNDDAFPKLKVREISLPSKDIKYYLKGKEAEENEIVSAPPEKQNVVKATNKDSIIEKLESKDEKDPNIFKRKKLKRGFVRNY